MSDQPTIYEIDVNKKYILCLEGLYGQAEYERIRAYIAKWLEDPKQPIIILNGNAVKLIKVETP